MASIRTVDSSGQILLGQKFAGRNILIDEIDIGVWLIKTGDFIPDNERWLHVDPAQSILDEAIKWAECNGSESTDLSKLEKQISDE